MTWVIRGRVTWLRRERTEPWPERTFHSPDPLDL